MDALRGLMARLRAMLRGRQADRDLDDEIRSHIEMETAKNLALGKSPDEARRLALAVFGGRDAALEAHRDVRGARWISDFSRDTRFALRSLRHNPVLTVAAILTLAVGIGANTAIFSTLHAVVLRPLPFKDAGRLVMLYETNPERGWTQAEVAPANFFDWREQVKAFEDIAGYPSFGTTTVLSHDGEAQVMSVMQVTGNFFDVLGVRPLLGRAFTNEETWDTGERIAMISHRLWSTRFGSDSTLVGKTITLGGYSVRVVGIVPQGFVFPGWNPDVYRPTMFARSYAPQAFFRRAHWLRAIARLKPGVSEQQANGQLQVVVQRLQQEYPATNTKMGAGMRPLHRFLVGDVRQPLLALQVAVGLLLLIACANVGNLLLVRAADRERESVVRLALGAGRGRLVRQALSESLVLSTLGGLSGVALGWAGTRVLSAMQPEGMLPVRDIAVNLSVLGFALGISVVSGLLFGIGPALWAGRRAPAEVLKEGGRGTGRTRLRRWSQGLAVAEVAIALVLLAGAGLLVRSWLRVQSVDPGFASEGVLTIAVSLPAAVFDTQPKRDAFYASAIERFRAIPGVEQAGTVTRLSMTETGWSSDFHVDGREREDFGVEVLHREISPAYHDALRIPLQRGRAFTDADNAGAPSVVLINEALAKKYFANDDPIGKRVAFDRYPDSTSFWRTIVGVVGSERQAGLESESRPEFFAPVLQDENGPRAFVIRANVPPVTIIAPARAILTELDRRVAINAVRPMTEVRDTALARRKFVMTLVLTFAAAGLLLALVGVYGVMAQLARGRRREIGIRVALGAPLTDIRGMVVRRSLSLGLSGVAIGLAGSLLVTRTMQSLLYGVSPVDPLSLVLVGVTLALAAVAASLPTAWRASRVNPTETLRAE
jgi:putative ABC transport system permease protein